MSRIAFLLACSALLFIGCDSDDDGSDPAPSAGGSSGAGGDATMGGMDTPPPAAGGAMTMGGTPAMGGAPDMGGEPSMGGEPAMGGAPGAGGEPAMGGAPGVGGAPGMGGEPGMGGDPDAGGAANPGDLMACEEACTLFSRCPEVLNICGGEDRAEIVQFHCTDYCGDDPEYYLPILEGACEDGIEEASTELYLQLICGDDQFRQEVDARSAESDMLCATECQQIEDCYDDDDPVDECVSFYCIREEQFSEYDASQMLLDCVNAEVALYRCTTALACEEFVAYLDADVEDRDYPCFAEWDAFDTACAYYP